jgi:hypothetical protein
MLLLFSVLTLVGATIPQCSVFFWGNSTACAGRRATVWIDAAQDEAARFSHTQNGGWLQPGCAGGSKRSTIHVAPASLSDSALVCVDRWDLPRERCGTKHCNFCSHHELFHSDTDCNQDTPVCHNHDEDEHDEAHKRNHDQHAACRSIASWASIGWAKVSSALDLQEQEEFDKATSAAYAAEFIFSHLNKWIFSTTPNAEDTLLFINDAARAGHHYRHVNSASRTSSSEVQVSTVMRVVQSVRQCHGHADAHVVSSSRRQFGVEAVIPGAAVAAGDSVLTSGDVSSLIVLSSFNGSDQIVDPRLQVLLAPGGALPDFDATVAPPNHCAANMTATNLASYDPRRVYPGSSPQDSATARYNGDARIYLSLSPASSCPAIVTLVNLQSNVDERSVTQIQRRNPNKAVQPDVASAHIEAATFMRSATASECTDFTTTFTNTFVAIKNNTASGFNSALSYVAPPAGVPRTLAPGESRCVGGDRAGEACTMKSECGTGLACRRKPFAPRDVAYCYDGVHWDTNRPCAFADEDEECPFGRCFGEVDDNAGGAYPMLHFYEAHECQLPAQAGTPVCSEPHVAAWHQYPNSGAFQ